MYSNRMVMRIKPVPSPMQVQVLVTVLQDHTVGLIWAGVSVSRPCQLCSSGEGPAFKCLLSWRSELKRNVAWFSGPRKKCLWEWEVGMLYRVVPRGVCHSWMCQELRGLEAIHEPQQKDFWFCKLKKSDRHSCGTAVRFICLFSYGASSYSVLQLSHAGVQESFP